MMPVLITTTAAPVIIITPQNEASISLAQSAVAQITISSVGVQGPPGPADTDSFKVPARFSELPDDTARAQARDNLGVETIDLGTFN